MDSFPPTSLEAQGREEDGRMTRLWWDRVRISAALLGAGAIVLAVLSLPDAGAW